MNLLKEWEFSKYETYYKKCMSAFDKWWKGNIRIVYGNGKNAEEIFGLPFNDTSGIAGLWNVQATAFAVDNCNLRFIGVAITTENEIAALFWDNETQGDLYERIIDKIDDEIKYVNIHSDFLSGEERQILTVIISNLRELNTNINNGLFTIDVMIVDRDNRCNCFHIMRNGKSIVICEDAMQCHYAVAAILRTLKSIEEGRK